MEQIYLLVTLLNESKEIKVIVPSIQICELSLKSISVDLNYNDVKFKVECIVKEGL